MDLTIKLYLLLHDVKNMIEEIKETRRTVLVQKNFVVRGLKKLEALEGILSQGKKARLNDLLWEHEQTFLSYKEIQKFQHAVNQAERLLKSSQPSLDEIGDFVGVTSIPETSVKKLRAIQKLLRAETSEIRPLFRRFKKSNKAIQKIGKELGKLNAGIKRDVEWLGDPSRAEVRKIAEEVMSPHPNIQIMSDYLARLQNSGVKVEDVIDEIGKAIEDVLKEKREQQADIVAQISELQGMVTNQSVGAIFSEFGIPVLIPETANRLVEILNLPPAPEASRFSKEKLLQGQFITSQILGFDVPSLIEVKIDPEQLKSAENPRELFKHFLEIASQLVLNENIAVRVHIKGISKLASRFPRNSNDPFSVVINHDDKLIIFNGKIENFDPFFHIPASVTITSGSEKVSGSRVMSDFYATNKTDVVFGNDVNVLSEFLMGAAIKLTQKTHEALIAYDQQTFRLTAPGALELMLHVLAEKTKQRKEFAAAA